MQPTRLLARQSASLARALPVGGTVSARVPTHHGQDRHPSVKSVPGKPTGEWEPGRNLLHRIGKCLAFGCSPQQTADAAALVRTIVKTWPEIQMSSAACSTQEELVYKGPLWNGEGESLEGDRPPWQSIGRHTQLVRVAHQAAVRFLDHSLATAAPEDQKPWQELRDESGQMEGYCTPRLVLSDVWFSNVDVRPPVYLAIAPCAFADNAGQSCVVRPQNVSAYTRVDSFESFEEHGEFTLKVYMWSHKYMARIAEATLLMTYDRDANPKAKKPFLSWELRRMAALGRHPAAYDWAIQERETILSAVDRLEKGTWDRADAVEDFGSASTD